jgi:hypothetical protein
MTKQILIAILTLFAAAALADENHYAWPLRPDSPDLSTLAGSEGDIEMFAEWDAKQWVTTHAKRGYLDLKTIGLKHAINRHLHADDADNYARYFAHIADALFAEE